MRRPGETVQTFGSSVPLSEEEWGLVERPDGAWLARGGELLLPAASLSLVGRHNALNALAALALVSSVARIRHPVLDALRAFRGLPHRMERLGEADGVLFVNDSKATSVAATEVALAGLGRPVVLIAGGDGKGQGFAPLRRGADGYVRAPGGIHALGHTGGVLSTAGVQIDQRQRAAAQRLIAQDGR